MLTDPPLLDERPPTTRAPTPSNTLLGDRIVELRETFKAMKFKVKFRYDS